MVLVRAYVMALVAILVLVARATLLRAAMVVTAMGVRQRVVQAVLALAAQIVLVLVKQDAVEVV